MCFFGISLIDTGIASEKDWGINLLDEKVNESGVNEDGSTWYRQSGEDVGDNGYRCRWARMGGQSHDGSVEWTETVCFWPRYFIPTVCMPHLLNKMFAINLNLLNICSASTLFCLLDNI